MRKIKILLMALLIFCVCVNMAFADEEKKEGDKESSANVEKKEGDEGTPVNVVEVKKIAPQDIYFVGKAEPAAVNTLCFGAGDVKIKKPCRLGI